MAKATSHFVCQQCGYSSAKWLGKCPNCGTWGSLVEETNTSPARNAAHSAAVGHPISLQSIEKKSLQRISTKIEELDRTLGGGIVTGQVILLAGIPGIGKSTILLQLANNLNNVIYSSGEESASQISIRASRLGVANLPAQAGKNLQIIEGTDIDSVIAEVENLKNLDLLIIDSIQTFTTSDLSGMAGSVGQVRECAFRLVRLAKSKNIPIFIVGHVTKEGAVAGPAVLAHIVDTVLWFEGDKSLTLRLIRVAKNRFGPSDEVGVFEMQEKGLVSLTNPEKIFLSDNASVPGRVTSSIIQGSRAILVEIESLCLPSKLPFPKRVAQGIDQKRFEILLAVLIKHCKLPLYEYDCFVNVAGGITAKNPSVDLAICLSLASSFYNKALDNNLLAAGEVGLLGEIRPVMGDEKITKLSKSLKYTKLEKLSTIQDTIKKVLK